MWTFLILSLFSQLDFSNSCMGGFRYHARDASVILSEQESHALQEIEETQESQESQEYEYAYETRQCRPCSEETEAQIPRFFWGTNQEEDMNDVPCCDLDDNDYMEEETTTEIIQSGLRMQNATQCGRKSLNRILGGIVTQDNEFPWQCALLKKDESFFGCGAVLLSCDPLIIATAAHCFVEEANPENIMVACGVERIDRPGKSPIDKHEVRLQVKEVIRHPDFSWLTAHHPFLGDNDGHPVGLSLFENDIAVFKFVNEEDMKCSKKKIWPACLPRKEENYAGWFKSGLAGWGQTRNDGNLSRALMKVRSPIVDDRTCQERVCNVNLGPIKIQNCIIADSHICAGGVAAKGPCRGDSGGSLIAQDKDLQGWAAVGLVSYQPGRRCGTDQYVVFTEISKFLPWIAQQFGLLPPE